MDTMARLKELAAERHLSLIELARQCSVPYSTLKSKEKRGGQLTVDTIAQICHGLHIPLWTFFLEDREKNLMASEYDRGYAAGYQDALAEAPTRRSRIA